jgi:hypothetical protein
MNNADIPAMPVNAHDYHNNGGYECESFGLTKREHFAAMAIQGLITLKGSDCMDKDITAKQCVAMADALLKELER